MKSSFYHYFKGLKASTSLFSVLVFLAFINTANASIVNTRLTNGTFCSGTFPSTYQVNSFSITEVKIKNNAGFTRGQTSKTFILGFNGTGFEFKPGTGTVTATGTEVTIVGYVITATMITVTISTSATNVQTNTISFNNIEIRATAAGSATIIRLTGGAGGNFLIDNKVTKPMIGNHFGALTVSSPLAYSSSTTTQTVTSSVFSGSVNNQILGLQVVVAGGCSSIPVTSFNITDASMNPLLNIANAKIYYTGTSNAFSTTTLFGTKTSPSGSFLINGTQTLSAAGTYYFWLTYDINSPVTSINGNTIDAQFTSVFIGGVPQAPTVSNPAGSRTISNNIYYSIAPGLWNNTTTVWSTTSGGVACGCAPTLGNGLVFINHAISLNVSATVDIVTVQTGGVLTNTATSALTINNALNTTGNGSFTITTIPWVLTNTDLSLAGTGTSGSPLSHTIGGSVTIGNGTTFQMSAASGTTLTVNGNLTVNGTLSLSGNNATLSNAAGTIIAGTGTISGTGTITTGVSKTIPAGSSLTINPILALASGITITNQGTVTTSNNITGAAASSTWINSNNSNLTMGGVSPTLLTTGTFTASASGNTVTYNGSGTQTVFGTTYDNLIISGSNTKTLSAATTVNATLTIGGAARLAAGANALNIDDQWVNNSSNGTPFSSSGTVTFTGSDCAITGSGVNTFNIISITGDLLSHPTAGRIIVTGNWINDGDFDANASDITFDGTTTISGSSITEFNHVILNTTKSLIFKNNDEIDIDGNFTVNGTFTSNNSLVVFSGSGSTQNIQGSVASFSFYDFEIDNTSGSVVLQKPVTITHSFTLTDGLITSSSTNSLTLNTGVTLTGGSATSFVNGPLIHVSTGSTTKVFPIGKGSDYRPVTLVITTTSSPVSNYTAELFNASAYALPFTTYPTGVNRVSGAHYWNISQSNATNFTNARVTLSYGANDDVTDPANLVIVKNTGSNTAWLDIGGTGSGTPSGTITSNTFTGAFATFTFGNKGSNGLPIELTSFKAIINSGNVDLSWITKSELNNDYFTIEKTKDGKSFEKVIEVAGAGNSKTELNYMTVDFYPYGGKSYYRLKQTDYDGTFTYSNLVAVSFSGNFDFSVYPNPVAGSIVNVKLSGNHNDEVTISLTDLNGNPVYSKAVTLKYENDILIIDHLDELLPGIYIITASNGDTVNHQRLVVQ